MDRITVKKLIEMLSNFDPDIEVWILDDEGCSYPMEGCEDGGCDSETKIVEIY